MSNIQKAQELVAQGEKALKKVSLLTFFSGNKYEEAAELFTQAANHFKLEKKWPEAADAFKKAADCQLEMQQKHEAASSFVLAANCCHKFSPKDCIESLHRAIGIFTDLGRFNVAAKHQKEIAEIYETEIVDLEQAIASYQTAADWFMGEESRSSANGCLVKVAQFSAQLEKYDRAIEIYEQLGQTSSQNSILRFSVRDYFFKAGLCYLCQGDFIGAQRALTRYQEMDASFGSSRECKFLQDIMKAHENNDVDAFTATVVEFDSLSKLDSWKTSALLKIKRSIGDISLT